MMKEEQSHESFIQSNKKSVNRNEKYEIVLNNKALDSQFIKITDAFVLMFLAYRNETSDKTLHILTKIIKPLKKVRKIDLNLEDCGIVTDEGLKILSKGLERLSSLQSVKLDFNSCEKITDKSLENIIEGLTRLGSCNL